MAMRVTIGTPYRMKERAFGTHELTGETGDRQQCITSRIADPGNSLV